MSRPLNGAGRDSGADAGQKPDDVDVRPILAVGGLGLLLKWMAMVWVLAILVFCAFDVHRTTKYFDDRIDAVYQRSDFFDIYTSLHLAATWLEEDRGAYAGLGYLGGEPYAQQVLQRLYAAKDLAQHAWTEHGFQSAPCTDAAGTSRDPVKRACRKDAECSKREELHRELIRLLVAYGVPQLRWRLALQDWGLWIVTMCMFCSYATTKSERLQAAQRARRESQT